MQLNGVFNDNFFVRPTDEQNLSCPVLIVGGSTAAYSATLGALKAGASVYLVQPTKILGGQFTAQALPASDDGPHMSFPQAEAFAISTTQREFRNRQRALQTVEGTAVANPGGGWVSSFATTPDMAATALNEALESYLSNGRLVLIPNAEPIEVKITQEPGQPRRVTGVVFRDSENGHKFMVNCQIAVEATDLGDLLELGDIESRVGQEAQSETGEAVLPSTAYPNCQQSFTFGAIVERTSDGDGTPIGAPNGYDRQPWLQSQDFTSTYWLNSHDRWEARDFFHSYGIFSYRRLKRKVRDVNIISADDVAVINWSTSPRDKDSNVECCGNDCRFGVLTGVNPTERQRNIQQARERAQGYIHFLQTNGIPNLKPRGDLSWTEDGIALMPYVREARRGVALTTIRHEDIAKKFFPTGAARAQCFDDSVGIGEYQYLDIHPNDATGHVDLGDGQISLPFTIPLGALIPTKTDGLILSSKSIGTTHITNAVYRMHPVEWAIGEASGYLAALALSEGINVRDVATNEVLKRKLQGLLTRNGIPIFWFDDVGHADSDFEAIQVLAAADIVRSEAHENLNFNPEGSVSRAVAAATLVNVLGLDVVRSEKPTFKDVPPQHWAYDSIETLSAKGITLGVGDSRFAPEEPIVRADLASFIESAGQLSMLVSNGVSSILNFVFSDTPIDRQDLKRRELSRVLYKALCIKSGLLI